jgi:hypothetical protein
MYYDVKKLAFAGAVAFLLLSGCTGSNSVGPANGSQINTPPNVQQYQSDKEKAIASAKQFINSPCVLETNADWANSAVVSDAFPVYLDGVESVSYYECKVQNNGNDAGYVLVNINQTDVPITEYCTEGKTTSEKLAKEDGTKISDLRIIRHNWFTTFAEKKSSDGLGKETLIFEQESDGARLAKKGATGYNEFNAARLAFIERVKKAGNVNPQYSKDRLTLIFNRDKIIADSMKNHPSELGKTSYTDRWTSDELNNTFGNGWHLPRWTQPVNASNQVCGCSPLALTLMYAYHRQFNGKTKLFNGLNLNGLVPIYGGTAQTNGYTDLASCENQTIRDVAFKIATDCHADFKTAADGGTGVGFNALENDGELYGDGLGYDAVLDQDYGGDFTKGKTVLGHIRAERPCMFQFYTDPPTNKKFHAAAIEGAKYQERKYIWNWYDREMWYLVNYGWGNSKERVWICVDTQFGSDATEYKNTGNLYMWIN